MCCSVKYVGVYSYLLGLALVAHDFWERVLGNLKLTKVQVFCQFLARSLAFFVVPLAVYIGVFYIHLSTLTNAGPHDSAMSSAFQASLEVFLFIHSFIHSVDIPLLTNLLILIFRVD